MKLRHIVVEGPDGAGKSTLIGHLTEILEYPIHPKASDSVKGPVDFLNQWVDRDMSILRGEENSYLYDRHPVISEPIYGRVVRGHTQWPFESSEFLREIREIMYQSCLVVWCLPNLHTVITNVIANGHEQMAGVVPQIAKVHQAYETAYFRWAGSKCHYDYSSSDLNRFTDDVRRMVTE